MTLAEKYYTYWNSKTPSERLENYYSLLDVPNKDNDEWTELLVLERLVAADVALRMGATA